LNTRWLFPHGKNLTRTGHNNSSIEAFLDNIGNSLTREVIQNSLDAKNDLNEEPVRMELKEFSFPTANIPGIEEIKNFALPRAKEMWQEYQETHEFLLGFEKVIQQDKIPILQISDYNTTGLNSENFESLVEGNNFSTKNNVDSAGSKGIGKAAPFAASDLRMVFYSSNSVKNGVKSTGVLNFVSFPFDLRNKKDITQERGILKTTNDGYLQQQITFGQKERTAEEFGTDIFLIGLKQLGDWKERMIRAVLNNFLVSIFNKELEVIVYGELISADTLGKVFESVDAGNLRGAERTEFIATQNYYKVLTNPESIVVNLPDEMVEKYDFIHDTTDATLYLLDIEPSNRKILQTRKAGMKIYERGYIDSIINFTGIFQATGVQLNKFLKDLENANHDKWSVDRKQGSERRQAQDLLADLLHWFRDEVKSNYGFVTDDISDAIGVSDLLPIQDAGNGQGSQDSGIKNKFKGAKIKETSSTSPLTDAEKEEEDLVSIAEELGRSEDDDGTSGPGSDREGQGGGENPDNEFGFGNQSGNSELDEDSEETVVTQTKKPVGKSDVKLKIVGVDYSQGNYILVGRANKNIDKLSINLKSVGDNGSTYNVKILDSQSAIHETNTTTKEIVVNHINKGDKVNIHFSIADKLKLKMEVVMHEIKG